MAFRELIMIEVKELLRRWQAGHGVRRVAEETGCDRKTVRRYFAAVDACALSKERELTDGEVHEVAQRVQARPVRAPSEARVILASQHADIAAWLDGSGGKKLRLQKVHTLLARRGVDVPYATLRRYAIDELGWHKPEPTVRIDEGPPGQEAQVDFGEMGRIVVDVETGERHKLWALVITLVVSRYMFVWPTLRQTTAAVCEGLDAAWAFFEGMPYSIIPDNTSAMIKDTKSLTPVLVEAFLDYVQARGFFVDPARVRRPKDKARVENQVAYVRENWFDGETFHGLDDTRRRALVWSRETAGGRIHGTTRKVPREHYEAVEKIHMKAPPDTPFDVPTYATPKLHADHHVVFARALYSAPHLYLHKTLKVRGDSKLVKIYFGTELIKTHPRQQPGGRSTDANDYPPGKSVYALRDVDSLITRAKGKGHHVGVYAERILAGPLPWSRMRQAYALLGLCEKYGDGRVEAVCQSALAFDVIDVARIKNKLAVAARPADERGKLVQLPLPLPTSPRFARSAAEFATARTSPKETP
jgi:transposase